MRIQFCGGVRSVTGSMDVLEIGERRILLECGLYQGRRSEARKRNKGAATAQQRGKAERVCCTA